MTWSQKTTGERIDLLIWHYKTMIESIDPTGTALTHETYVNDRDRYDLVCEWNNFVRQLESLKEEKQK